MEDPAVASDANRLVELSHEIAEAGKIVDALYVRWHELEEMKT